MLNFSEKVRLIAKRKKITLASIAKKLEQSPQSFNSKLNRNSFDEKEMHQVAELLGCKFVSFLEMPDGEKI